MLVAERGIEPEIVEYPRTPCTAAQLKRLPAQLKLPAAAFLRKNEAADAGIDPKKMSKEALIAAVARHPIILERPIATSGSKAALGRPAERVLSVP